ncbi:hypothetical protein [Streptomyces sp. SID12488]|uniref:hypothetical protein n=1 Tax=Streptomyces sp. SID12488 TaxID=2706040 RepID=UPI0013D9C96F|nr:hypothetical protein [Streptomyces sp. SID12488]NEA68645.1 hypothetical protein [Streptomyces sp. SID12488]
MESAGSGAASPYRHTWTPSWGLWPLAAAPVLGDVVLIDYSWNSCTTTEGGFVDGHVAAPEGEVDADSLESPPEPRHPPRAGELYPLQGAEPYLRSLANRKDVVARLRTALAEWEEAQRRAVPTPASAVG